MTWLEFVMWYGLRQIRGVFWTLRMVPYVGWRHTLAHSARTHVRKCKLPYIEAGHVYVKIIYYLLLLPMGTFALLSIAGCNACAWLQRRCKSPYSVWMGFKAGNCALASIRFIMQHTPWTLGRSRADNWSTAWRRPLPTTPMTIVPLPTPSLPDYDGRW